MQLTKWVWLGGGFGLMTAVAAPLCSCCGIMGPLEAQKV